MTYGFDKPLETLKLPQQVAPKKAEAVDMSSVLQAGSSLGFVSREATARRKTGPKRTEPQDKVTIAGPKRIIDRLKAYCDRQGGIAYHTAIEAMLDAVEK